MESRRYKELPGCGGKMKTNHVSLLRARSLSLSLPLSLLSKNTKRIKDPMAIHLRLKQGAYAKSYQKAVNQLKIKYFKKENGKYES